MKIYLIKRTYFLYYEREIKLKITRIFDNIPFDTLEVSRYELKITEKNHQKLLFINLTIMKIYDVDLQR
jgi:hypothetical protein